MSIASTVNNSKQSVRNNVQFQRNTKKASSTKNLGTSKDHLEVYLSVRTIPWRLSASHIWPVPLEAFFCCCHRFHLFGAHQTYLDLLPATPRFLHCLFGTPPSLLLPLQPGSKLYHVEETEKRALTLSIVGIHLLHALGILLRRTRNGGVIIADHLGQFFPDWAWPERVHGGHALRLT